MTDKRERTEQNSSQDRRAMAQSQAAPRATKSRRHAARGFHGPTHRLTLPRWKAAFLRAMIRIFSPHGIPEAVRAQR